MRWLLFFLLAVCFIPLAHSKEGFRPLKNPVKSKNGFYSLNPADSESSSDFEVPQAPKEPSLERKNKDAGKAEIPVDIAEEENGLIEKEKSLEDFSGVTVSGIPRLIRASPETEVFFRDVNTSYIISQDSKHNQYFKVFEEASRVNKSVSFRVDPVTRRVLAMDGVQGVRAKSALPITAPSVSRPSVSSPTNTQSGSK